MASKNKLDTDTADHEIASGGRFKFGENWSRYLDELDDEKIAEADESLMRMLGIDDIQGMSFLDVGSGSGLMSLVARRRGAVVRSFDYDPMSVACTERLKAKYFPDDESWIISSGSALDQDFMKSLGNFEIVYSWGVLHHTGKMWEALENVIAPVKQEGLLFIMIYKDRGLRSKLWRKIKKLYCSNFIGRALVTGLFIPYYLIRGFIEDIFRLENPRKRYVEYKRKRGMSKFYDWIDWLGGYPFEVASKDELVSFYEKKGFSLVSHDNQEYVFKKQI